MPMPGRWKGKARDMSLSTPLVPSQALALRDVTMEGTGGSGGVVLPLDTVEGGSYDVSYSIPVKFGASGQQFSLQIDTGSSDLWVSSTSCSTASCALTKGRLYDPSGSRPTGKSFSIPYLQGSASGPIVWDMVLLGGYSIDNQALAAASDVQGEPLSPDFSGILGLALPLNSIIAQQIPPVTSNAPDGAAWASNLFSITPISDAPASRFLSLSLARPGSSTIPSLLGIGRHPAALVPDPSQVQYSGLVSDRSGVLFWKASVRAITVYVNGIARPIDLGRSVNGGAFPSAVLDSGVPLILTTSMVANAIYGAIGVTPSSDGNYYVPCITPLNLTITLDNRTATPVHPLDLTSEPPDNNNAQFCVGLIQPADSVLAKADNAIGDMILGVPFMRNIYTVMAYTPPNPDGSFPIAGSPVPTTSIPSSDGINSDDDQPSDTPSVSRVSPDINPALGVLSLTDPTVALAEFTTVRILNQPLASSTTTPPDTGANANTKTVSVGGRHLAVGIIVLIGLAGLFALCVGLFAGRWVLMKRTFKRGAIGGNESQEDLDRKTAYMMARRTRGGAGVLGTVPLVGSASMTEDELRELRFQNWKRLKEEQASEDTERTLADGGGPKDVDEFGVVGMRKSKRYSSDDDAWEEGPTLVERKKLGDDDTRSISRLPISLSEATPLVGEIVHDDQHAPSLLSYPERGKFPAHMRDFSDVDRALDNSTDPRRGSHTVTSSISTPLLSGSRYRERTASYADTVEAIATSHARYFSVDDDGEGQVTDTLEGALPIFPPAVSSPLAFDGNGDGESSRLYNLRLLSPRSVLFPSRQDSDRLLEPNSESILAKPLQASPIVHSIATATEPAPSNEGMGTGMAGVGSAARTSLPHFADLGLGPRPSIQSLPFNRESLTSASVMPGYALGSPTALVQEEDQSTKLESVS